MPAEPALLDVRGLAVSYRRPGTRRRFVRAVDGVDVTLARGELVALVGESGSGKTTTAQAIARLVPVLSGVVRVDGVDIATLRSSALRALRRRVQIVFQDPYESLDPRWTIARLVEEPLVIHRIGTRAERRRTALEALERVGLVPGPVFARRFPHELSGGERQRVAIAGAIVLRPDLLIADEPVSMLDVSLRAGILDLLDELRREGLGVLMITHDLSTAAAYADRILVMYLGRVVEHGLSGEILRNAQHPYTQALMAAVPRIDAGDRAPRETPKGEIPDPADTPAGCRFHPRCPVALPLCSSEEPPVVAVARTHEVACVHARVETTESHFVAS